TSHSQRRNRNRSVFQKRPHVRNMTGYNDAGDLAEPFHRRRRIRSDNTKLDTWNRSPNGRENAFGEVQHSIDIRVVVHAPQKNDHGLRSSGTTVWMKITPIDSVGNNVMRPVDF